MALVFGLGQILPAFRRGQTDLFGFHCVETDRGHISVHAGPGRRCTGVHETGVELFDPCRRIRLKHALALKQQQRCRSKAPHNISLRIVFFREQLGGHNACGVAHPVDLNVGIGLLECLFVAVEINSFDRGIDGQVRLSKSSGSCKCRSQTRDDRNDGGFHCGFPIRCHILRCLRRAPFSAHQSELADAFRPQTKVGVGKQ